MGVVVFAISGSLSIDLREHIGSGQVEVERDHILGGMSMKAEFETTAMLKEQCE